MSPLSGGFWAQELVCNFKWKKVGKKAHRNTGTLLSPRLRLGRKGQLVEARNHSRPVPRSPSQSHPKWALRAHLKRPLWPALRHGPAAFSFLLTSPLVTKPQLLEPLRRDKVKIRRRGARNAPSRLRNNFGGCRFESASSLLRFERDHTLGQGRSFSYMNTIIFANSFKSKPNLYWGDYISLLESFHYFYFSNENFTTPLRFQALIDRQIRLA